MIDNASESIADRDSISPDYCIVDIPTVNTHTAMEVSPTLKGSKSTSTNPTSLNNINTAAGGTNGFSRVLFSTYKYWWSKGERSRALSELSAFLKTTQVNPLTSSERYQIT